MSPAARDPGRAGADPAPALPAPPLGVDPAAGAAIAAAEREEIVRRRQAAGAPGALLTGISLSGGGIRSATFALGVLQALARRGLLRDVDYLSTVSGGGYLGAWLSAFVDRDTSAAALLDPRGEPVAHLRNRCMRHLLGSRPLRNALQALVVYLGGLLCNTSVALAFVATALLARWNLAVFAGEGWKGCFWPAAGVATALLLMAAVPFAALRLPAALALLGDAAAAAYQGLAWTHASIRGHVEHWLLGLAAALVVAAVSAIVCARPRIANLLLNVIAAGVVPVAAAYAYFALLPAVLPRAGVPPAVPWLPALALLLALVIMATTNINLTSSHRFYRDRLGETFLLRGREPQPVRRRLSELSQPFSPAPYHLLQATVNLPGSRDPLLRGRRSDVFVFSKHWCGSAATGYAPTAEFERRDPHLDLGTAMAVSGAAMSSLMGAHTPAGSPLLTFLNLRLGYWLPNAARARPRRLRSWRKPNLFLFVDELFRSVDETRSHLNVSDGAHSENLGLYELLRRQCGFIVAIDAEADPGREFDGLIRCIRRASVDLGVRVRIDLQDLQPDAAGRARAPGVLATVEYPSGRRGQLLYVKATLSGGESAEIEAFHRRHPAFPHQTTLHQAFDEEQFEAYRALGEHAGERLLAGQPVESAAQWLAALQQRAAAAAGLSAAPPAPAAKRSRTGRS